MNLNNSKIHNNIAEGFGDGIYNLYGTAKLKISTKDNNRVIEDGGICSAGRVNLNFSGIHNNYAISEP